MIYSPTDFGLTSLQQTSDVVDQLESYTIDYAWLIYIGCSPCLQSIVTVISEVLGKYYPGIPLTFHIHQSCVAASENEFYSVRGKVSLANQANEGSPVIKIVLVASWFPETEIDAIAAEAELQKSLQVQS